MKLRWAISSPLFKLTKIGLKKRVGGRKEIE